MKQYTRRSALKLLGLGTVAVVGFGLTGCGGSGGDVKNASEPVPASQAFGQAGVWMVYDGDERIGKDVAIESVLSFDGNGNVTSYQCGNLTFGDLNGLSDEEVIELAKQQDEAAFDAAKQSATDATSEAIEIWQNDYDTLKSELDSGTYASMLGDRPASDMSTDEVASAQEMYGYVLSDLESNLNNANDGQSSNESAEYQEPEAVPFTLHVETDGSGNSAQSETLSFETEAYAFYTTSADGDDDLANLISFGPSSVAQEPGEVYKTSEETIELWSSSYSTTETVYDTTFGGYSGLATVVSEGHAGFTWDTPDTEGIEVD